MENVFTACKTLSFAPKVLYKVPSSVCLLTPTYGVHTLVIPMLTLAVAFSKGATASIYIFESRSALFALVASSSSLFLLSQGFLGIYTNVLIMKHALYIVYSSHLSVSF